MTQLTEPVALLTGPSNIIVETRKQRTAKLSKYKRMRKVYDAVCQEFYRAQQEFLQAKREYEQADRAHAEQTKLTTLPPKKEPKKKQKKQPKQTEDKDLTDVAKLLANMSEEQIANTIKKIKKEV